MTVLRATAARRRWTASPRGTSPASRPRVIRRSSTRRLIPLTPPSRARTARRVTSRTGTSTTPTCEWCHDPAGATAPYHHIGPQGQLRRLGADQLQRRWRPLHPLQARRWCRDCGQQPDGPGPGHRLGVPHDRVLVGQRRRRRGAAAQDGAVHDHGRYPGSDDHVECSGELRRARHHHALGHGQQQRARTADLLETRRGDTDRRTDDPVAQPASGTQAHTLEFWSVDAAGNVELPHKTASFTVTADTVAPTTTSNAPLYDRTSTNCSRSCGTDPAPSSGVAATYCRQNGTPYASQLFIPSWPGHTYVPVLVRGSCGQRGGDEVPHAG